MIEWIFALAFVGLVVALTYLPEVLRNRRSRPGSAYTKEQRAEFERKRLEWEKEYERKNPKGPPISPEEHAAFRAWLDQQERPAVRFSPSTELGGAHPDGSRIGGPAWLAEGQDWPLSKNGQPMEFLCQIDFLQTPPLEGFPTDGVLQFFLPTDDDMWGMDFDEPVASDVAILHRARGKGTRRIDPAPLDPDYDMSPLSHAARSEGVALEPSPYTARIPWEHWRVAERYEGKGRREGIEQWDAILEADDRSAELSHHIGGYPIFAQSDFRMADRFDDYDVCLLNLTSDKHLMWGDAGEANFLIRHEDLAKGDFSRVIFWWDCS